MDLICQLKSDLGCLDLICQRQMPPPSLSSLFVALSQQTGLLQGLTIKTLAQIWKKLHKINDVIDNDVIIMRKLAEKTVRRT